MSRSITSIVGSLVLGGASVFSAADVLQLPTQTLSQYNGGVLSQRLVNNQLVPVLQQSAYTVPGLPVGPVAYAPGDQVIETISAPAGERFVITPGTAPTYLSLQASFGIGDGFGAGFPQVSFAGLSGTAPQPSLVEFYAGAEPATPDLSFSGDWAAPGPCSFTSITFTGTVAPEPVITDATFQRVAAILFAYEPDPPGSASDVLLSLQPIPEPAGMLALLAAPFLLLRKAGRACSASAVCPAGGGREGESKERCR